MTEIISQPSARPTALWWYRRPGVVYFLGAGIPLKAIKIGVTTIFGDLKDDDDGNLKDGDKNTDDEPINIDLKAFDPNVFNLEDDDLKEGLKASILRRLNQVQSSNHETIVVLGIIPFLGGKRPARYAELWERKLHIHFAELQRFKPHTRGAEWFNLAPELLDYIDKHSCRPEKLNVPKEIGLPINRQRDL